MTKISSSDRRMKDLIQLAASVAQSKASILIQGETGSGKKRLAAMIHECSSRASKTFISVSCEGSPSNLLDSELFGYEKGAFPGAAAAQAGKFEFANGGTILLEEIGALDFHVQDKLLQVLQASSVQRMGGAHPTPVDVRVIATTQRNLAQMVREGKFLEDLFYRLNVVNLTVPPLRERPSDVSLISHQLLQEFSSTHSKKISEFSPSALAVLESHSWPGNIRELESVIERAVIDGKNGEPITNSELHLQSVRSELHQNQSGWLPGRTLDQIEKNVILDALRHHEGNRTHTAKSLGISIRTLRNKLSDYRRDGLDV